MKWAKKNEANNNGHIRVEFGKMRNFSVVKRMPH